jgi:hypothetical protein
MPWGTAARIASKKRYDQSEKGKRTRQLRECLYQQKIKKIVLTFYGKDCLGDLNKQSKCCWPKCNVIDLDMLTLDHINNDGAKHRNSVKYHLYKWIKSHNFPNGFQTLCWNHQWKKRIKECRRKQRVKARK